MVRYPSVSVPPITGAIVTPPSQLRAWQPSTWPKAPAKWNAGFSAIIRRIFEDSMLNEIDNVIADAHDNLEHRGHVVAIALLCALDAISSYGYGARSGRQIPDFVRAHLPADYRPHADALLRLYRHTMVHSWNLFEAAVLPGNDPVTVSNGRLCFGLLHFRKALSEAVESYFKKLATDSTLQTMTLRRYRKLKSSAKT